MDNDAISDIVVKLHDVSLKDVGDNCSAVLFKSWRIKNTHAYIPQEIYPRKYTFNEVFGYDTLSKYDFVGWVTVPCVNKDIMKRVVGYTDTAGNIQLFKLDL